jgi:hypothetical protein
MNKCELRKEPYEVPGIVFYSVSVEMGFTISTGVSTTDPEYHGPGSGSSTPSDEMEDFGWE